MASTNSPGKVVLFRLDAPQEHDDESIIKHCAAFAENGSLLEQCDSAVLEGSQTVKPELVSEFILNVFTRDTAR